MEMLITNDEFLNLTPPDRAERVAYVMYRFMSYGAQESAKGIKDETVTDIIHRNWFKLYSRWRHEDSKVARFADLTDAKIALEVMRDIHKANRLDLLEPIAQYSGEYQKMIDKEFNIVRGDAFGYGANTPLRVKTL